MVAYLTNARIDQKLDGFAFSLAIYLTPQCTAPVETVLVENKRAARTLCERRDVQPWNF